MSNLCALDRDIDCLVQRWRSGAIVQREGSRVWGLLYAIHQYIHGFSPNERASYRMSACQSSIRQWLRNLDGVSAMVWNPAVDLQLCTTCMHHLLFENCVSALQDRIVCSLHRVHTYSLLNQQDLVVRQRFPRVIPSAWEYWPTLGSNCWRAFMLQRAAVLEIMWPAPLHPHCRGARLVPVPRDGWDDYYDTQWVE